MLTKELFFLGISRIYIVTGGGRNTQTHMSVYSVNVRSIELWKQPIQEFFVHVPVFTVVCVGGETSVAQLTGTASVSKKCV